MSLASTPRQGSRLLQRGSVAAQWGMKALSANSKSYAPFSDIRSKGSAADKKGAYNDLRAADTSIGLPAWSSCRRGQPSNDGVGGWAYRATR
jgi:hypothetical protein